MEHPKVTDMDNHPQTFEWAKAKYGVAYRRAEVPVGQKVYRLIELWEKTGHHSLITQVLDEDGRPIDQIGVAFYWSDAPDPPDPPTEIYPGDWYRNFIWGFTNLNGDVGPGMGRGAYHGRGEGGPHAVWVRDPDIPSDICEKLGMLAGTNHDHLDQKFQLMVVTEDGEVPAPEELEIKEYVVETPALSNMLYIAWPTKLGVGVDVHARSPVNPDHDTSRLEEWHAPDGTRYVRGGVCADFEGDAPRLFEIWAYRLPNPADRFTPVAEYEFLPLEQGPMKTVVCIVDYKEEPEPPPPPPPPEPECDWAIKSVERREGISLLVGLGLPNGTAVTVSAPWGSPVTVVAGSKANEWGLGGWEINIWNPAMYTIGFFDCLFEVEVGSETVIVTFEEITQPPGPPQARLVSPWILKTEAEALLEELKAEGFDCFTLEEK